MKLIQHLILVILLVIITNLKSEAQVAQGLDHLLRKAKMDTLILPCQKMNPKAFQIKFPDSIYSQSRIRITKLKLAGIRKVQFQLHSKDRRIQKVKYVIKGKKNFREFQELLIKSANMKVERLESIEAIKIDNCSFNLTLTPVRRKYSVLLELNE